MIEAESSKTFKFEGVIAAMAIALCSVTALSYAQNIPNGVLIARGGHTSHSVHLSHVSHSRPVSRSSARFSHSAHMSRPSTKPLSSTSKGRTLHAKSNAVKQTVPTSNLPPVKQTTPVPSAPAIRNDTPMNPPVANTNTFSTFNRTPFDGGILFSIRNWFYRWWFQHPNHREDEDRKEGVK